MWCGPGRLAETTRWSTRSGRRLCRCRAGGCAKAAQFASFSLIGHWYARQCDANDDAHAQVKKACLAMRPSSVIVILHKCCLLLLAAEKERLARITGSARLNIEDESFLSSRSLGFTCIFLVSVPQSDRTKHAQHHNTQGKINEATCTSTTTDTTTNLGVVFHQCWCHLPLCFADE